MCGFGDCSSERTPQVPTPFQLIHASVFVFVNVFGWCTFTCKHLTLFCSTYLPQPTEHPSISFLNPTFSSFKYPLFKLSFSVFISTLLEVLQRHRKETDAQKQKCLTRKENTC